MKKILIAGVIIGLVGCYAEDDHDHEPDTAPHSHHNPVSAEWLSKRPPLYDEYSIINVEVGDKTIVFENQCTCDVHFGGDMEQVDDTTIFFGDEILEGHYVISDCTEVSQCSYLVHTGAYRYENESLTLSLPDETVTYIKY